MVPRLNVCVPRLLIPVAGEFPVVAPDMDHVRVVIPQLSVVVGLGVAKLLEQVPAATVFVIFAGQVIVGSCVSTTVTENEQEAVFCPLFA